VSITFGAHRLALEVVDDGHTAPGGEIAGHGLNGMRERVHLFGGELEAGALRDRGFRVRAELPLSEGSG
jgi:signal transduction histidine kinase